MSDLRFKLNRAGVAELMKSGAMQGILKSHANEIKNRAGTGFEQDIYVGKNRANARVWASTREARSDNLKNNTLLKSVK